MKSGFVPIPLEDYVRLHVKSNPVSAQQKYGHGFSALSRPTGLASAVSAESPSG